MVLLNLPATFSRGEQFAHVSLAAPTLLIISICRTCGDYVGATSRDEVIHLVERLHKCEI